MKVVGEISGSSFLVTGLDVAKYGTIIIIKLVQKRLHGNQGTYH